MKCCLKNRDAVMIAAAKLIATDFVPKDYPAPEIISHFVMHGTSVAEIVKHLITALKKKEDDLATIFLEALKKVNPVTITEENYICLGCCLKCMLNK